MDSALSAQGKKLARPVHVALEDLAGWARPNQRREALFNWAKAQFPLSKVFQLINYFSKYIQSSKFEITTANLPDVQKFPNLAS
jgi:hypothetical protein